jgi:hypothetical protein
MIVELVKMKSITGSAIQTKPSFNVMIGECYVRSRSMLGGLRDALRPASPAANRRVAYTRMN